MFIIFPAWYENTFVLYKPHARRGIFQRDYCFVCVCDLVRFRFASDCDRRNSFEPEMNYNLIVYVVMHVYIAA